MNNFIEIVHSVSGKLTDITDELEIYQIMNDGIKQILPESYFIITTLQPDDMNFRITHSFGFEKYLSAIKTLLGKDPYQMNFLFSDLSEVKQKEFQSRKLYHFSDGIYEIANGKINKTICKTIEKILGVSEVYAISLCIGEKYFGGATICIPQSTIKSGRLNKECILTIESLASQVSFAINKIRDFEALTKKKDELVIAQSKFNQLVDQLNDVVWVANGDGTEIIHLKNSFEKFFGYPSTQFIDNPHLWLDLVHKEDKAIALKSSEELFVSGNVESEYRMIREDGTIIWVHERKSIVYDTAGQPAQIGGVVSDITEKKLLEEELRLKDYALENSPNAIAFVDLHGVITYINNGYLKLFGYDNKTEVLGRSIPEFASVGDNPQKSLEKLNKGEVYVAEDQPIRKDGTTFHSIVLASSVIHNQKTLCIMAVFIDISELKEIEANLKESEAKLSKTNKEKDKFFTIIAHDLKSPFNGMLGLLEILATEYNDYEDEQRLKMIKSSYKAAQKAFSLLSDLLEWARLQNNQIEIKSETVNLFNIVNEIIEMNMNNALAKGISINNDIASNVQVDLNLNSIRTVVRNIFINAIKFTQDGGRIKFNLKQMNDAIELSIKDTGVGMSNETIGKLFKLDENVTMPGTNNEKGTGLGLLICNEIVVRNNWEMDVESQLGKGSTFRILIPTN